MESTKTETREEEVARVRSYLTSQAKKRTPAQMIENLQEARTQFIEVANSISDQDFYAHPIENEWSAAEVLEHVRLIALADNDTIVKVVETGEPVDFPRYSYRDPEPNGATKADLLQTIEEMRDQLVAAVAKADPVAHLEITWLHSEFGELNWREWLLFARVHTLDHVRQLQKIAAAL